MKKKILIIHDRFLFRGGAERLVLDMARGLGADIATGFWNETETYPKSDVPYKLFVLGNPSDRPGLRYLMLFGIFYFRTRFIKSYDIVIFSGNNCLSATHNVKKGAYKVFYCHTPVRHAFDLKEYYLQKAPWWKRQILSLFILGSKLVYIWGFRQMDFVISNSKNVQNRLKKYLKSDSYIINPPIQIEKFKWIDQKDYYLSFGRVDKLKRVTDIVKAFQQMPDKKLIISSGGDDLEAVKELAEGFDNIKVVGWVDDIKLQELVGNCIASIYIPIDEDFGMTQIESLSAGKPVIGVNEGGLAETIDNGVTGRLVSANYEIADIIEAVEWLNPKRSMSMMENCIEAAQRYSVNRFLEEMNEVINNSISYNKKSVIEKS